MVLLAWVACQQRTESAPENELERAPPPPIRLVLGESWLLPALRNEGTENWEVAHHWDSGPMLWLQSEQDGAWSWSHPQCPHRRDRDTAELAPGASLQAEETEVHLPRGRHRWIAWVRQPGSAWQPVASEAFEVKGICDGPYEPWEGWMPDWDDGVRIKIGSIRNPPPWKRDPPPDFFDFDIVIENRLGQEVEYNPSSNYWLCEGFGGWAHHPGSTICGNQASWPRVPPGGTGEHSWYGRGFGRFRFGMTFQKPHRAYTLAAALSEPFVVEPPAAPRR